MATTAEKNLYTQIGLGVAQETIATEAGLGILGSAGLGLAFLPLTLGLSAYINRQRFPKVSINRLIGQTKTLRRGLVPRITESPLALEHVISTQDQARVLPELIVDDFFRREIAPEIRRRSLPDVRRVRAEALAAGRAATAGLSFAPSLRGGVRRATASSPLEFLEGNFLP